MNGAVNFGQVSPFVPSSPVDVDAFNIGNAPLTIMPAPTFSGTNAAEFATVNPIAEWMRSDGRYAGRGGLVLHHRCDFDGGGFDASYAHRHHDGDLQRVQRTDGD